MTLKLKNKVRITKLPKGGTKAKLFEDLSVGDVITLEIEMRQRYSMPRMTITTEWGESTEGYMNQTAATLARFGYEEVTE